MIRPTSCVILILVLTATARPQSGNTALSILLEGESGAIGSSSAESRIRLRLDAPGATWIYVFLWTYVESTHPDFDEDVESLLEMFGWLEKPTFDPSALFPGNAVLPQPPPAFAHRDDVVLEHYARATANLDPDRVRAYCQPILIDSGGESPATLLWDAKAPTWLANPVPAGQLDLTEYWSRMLAFPASMAIGNNVNTTWFSPGRMMQQSVQQQAPSPAEAADFLNDWADKAAVWGLFVSAQAIAWEDPAGIAAFSANETTGLPSLPTAPPRLRFSDEAVVRIGLIYPGSWGGPGIEMNAEAVEPHAPESGQLYLALDGILPPLTCQISSGIRSWTIRGSFSSVGIAAFDLPPFTAGAELDILSITNATGTFVTTDEPWRHFTVTDLP